MKTPFVALFALLVVTGMVLLSGDSSSSNGRSPSLRKGARKLADEEVPTIAPTVLTDAQETYAEMVRYHFAMSPPCFHKAMYAMIGLLNPSLKAGLTEEEKDMVSFSKQLAERPNGGDKDGDD